MYIGKTERERAKFIANTSSGTYDGTTECDEYCVLHIEQGESMILKIQRKSKLEWLECIEYDKDGYQIGVFYEPFRGGI